MKKKTIKVVAAFFLVVFFSTMTGYIFGVQADRKRQENKEKDNNAIAMMVPAKAGNEKIEVIEKEDKITSSYILREDDGIVSLYSKYKDGREEIYQSYDIEVSFLPSADRQMLREGIEVQSLSEALQMVEDYS